MDLTSGIQTFVRVVEHGSLTRAARALGVTPSGVGKTLTRLEGELGLRLLTRTTRHVAMTEDGELFFEQCRKVLDELENARSMITSRRAAARGRLRVTIASTLGKLYLVPALVDFVAKHPDVKPDLLLTDRFVNIVEEGIDVAIRIGGLPDSSFAARRIGTQQIVTVAPPTLARRRRIATPADAIALPAVLFRRPSSGTPRPWTFAERGHVLTLHPEPRMSIDDGEALVAAVRAGLGVAQVPSYMAEVALAAGEVVEVLSAFRPPSEPIFAVHPARRNQPLRTLAFIEFLATRPIEPAVLGGPSKSQAPPRRRSR
ncbi:MAG: LysR family transcriptional regulator [Labilithrix sp.]|nr:LysR family transcriptional regulator [Labilithrix sp.]MCW5812357.1 LysR family transcriptional regulator [Labilithrix sp.]